MKKLLVLVVMLGLIVSANAMELKIYVNGAPVTGDIVATPGQIFDLSVYSTGFADGDGVYFGIVADPAVGIISGGALTAAAPDASFAMSVADLEGFMPIDNGVAAYIDIVASGGTKPAGVYFGGTTFVFASTGQVQLYTTDGDVVTNNLVGSANFVPEPITVALLGLGGLFIRRNKK